MVPPLPVEGDDDHNVAPLAPLSTLVTGSDLDPDADRTRCSVPRGTGGSDLRPDPAPVAPGRQSGGAAPRHRQRGQPSAQRRSPQGWMGSASPLTNTGALPYIDASKETAIGTRSTSSVSAI